MEIIEHEVEGRAKTCIPLGDDKIQIPRHMMQGEKQKGILLMNGEKKSWTWDGLCTIHAKRYVYFDALELESFDTIATVHRDRALEFVIQLAQILSQEKEAFVSPLVGVFPMWRVFIVSGSGLLVLPEDLGDLLSVYMSEEERYEKHGCYISRGTEAGFSLIRQFGQLLYFALTGMKPYEKEEIRLAGFHELPLSLYKDSLFSEADEKLTGFITFCLNAKEREQRDIMGNRTAWENLSWFISRSRELEWNVKAVKEGSLKAEVERISSSPEAVKMMEKIHKDARRRTFWRQKGTFIIILALVTAVVAGIAASYISNMLEPPYTKDMNQVEIIEAFYDAQSRLDSDGIIDPLKGVSAPQETEVISLYVTSQTRFAYEGRRPDIAAEKWIEAGKPAIPEGSFVYGVTDLDITPLEEENSWNVKAKYYTPYPYNELETVSDVPQSKSVCYVYDMSQDFSFTWNSRGWWNITDISPITVSLSEVLYIDTISQSQASGAE